MDAPRRVIIFTNRYRIAALSLLPLAFAAGCSSVRVTDYSDNKPLMIPEQFFNGEMTAHGVVKNRSGEVIRYFNADIVGYLEGDVVVLEEDFLFNDGEEQRRVWRFENEGTGIYTGTAGDVVGEAEGEVAGNAFFLDYTLRVPYGDGTIDLSIDDRMYLTDETTLLAESDMRKFGYKVGEILLVIKKQPD